MTRKDFDVTITRRHLLGAAAGSLLLQACAAPRTTSTAGKTIMTVQADAYNTVRLFASSGFAPDTTRIDLALNRLAQAGLSVSNTAAAYRRAQRFAGTDAERAADLQDVASGKVPTPQMLLGVRGGYGAARILPMIDWTSLGARMRERGTLLFGFSDVCAIQLALLAQGKMSSFAGPMLYSEFGKPDPSVLTMQHFVDTVSAKPRTLNVNSFIARPFRTEGIIWGGNLSVLVSLIGTPYFPAIDGGILFLEDVGEQPYRIDRMLHQLYLSGCLKKQQAIILGNFRTENAVDIYDAAYDLPMVLADLRRLTGIPIFTDFPFGHIRDKASFPLGVRCRLETDDGGYRVSFDDYPTMHANQLNLQSLVPSVFSLDIFEAEGSAASDAAGNNEE
ncbi:MAG: LD-carboxypeptidase [Neisseria sp.]|nr:LD-carboxypeptidase [Neisseria sp.]